MVRRPLVMASFALVASSLVMPSARAWGPEGHALIGQIADQLLQGTTAGRTLNTTAAKWADCVRSVQKEPSGEFKFIPDQFTAPCGAFGTPDELARMEDYAKRNWDTFPNEGRPDHEAYHFTDIPIQRGAYAPDDIGANDHDVVHAINAAIAELTGTPVPMPFSIKDDKEAILLLAHFVGDIHQPLHVEAIYLDAQGREVEPASQSEAEAHATIGGNSIEVGGTNLHHEWDQIAHQLQTNVADLVRQARAEPALDSPLSVWAVTWASESVASAKAAYSEVTFTGAGPRKWRATFGDRKGYLDRQHTEQERKVVEAGVRLAAMFKAIWP